MKKRLYFVSNSSSSSFICDISGEEASGWDMCLSDAGMYECVNGHTICKSYVKFDKEEVEKELREEAIDWIREHGDENYDEENEDDVECILDDIRGEFDYELPAKFCPCCNFSEMSPKDGYTYLLKSTGLTKELLRDELRARFGDYGEFREFLKKPLDKD
jgi:hypothetical protein